MAMTSSRAAGFTEGADVGGSALARVPVLPPLPLLVARLEAPGLRAEAPAKVEGVRAAFHRASTVCCGRRACCCELLRAGLLRTDETLAQCGATVEGLYSAGMACGIGHRYIPGAHVQKDGKRREDAFLAPPVQRVKAAMGQLLSWRLVLTNRSKLPVAGARISVMLPDVPERKGSRAALCGSACTCFDAHMDDTLVARRHATVTCGEPRTLTCKRSYGVSSDVVPIRPTASDDQDVSPHHTWILCTGDRPAAAEVGNAAQDSIGGMRVLVDNSALADALPLAPFASASVPILLHACTVRLRQAAAPTPLPCPVLLAHGVRHSIAVRSIGWPVHLLNMHALHCHVTWLLTTCISNLISMLRRSPRTQGTKRSDWRCWSSTRLRQRAQTAVQPAVDASRCRCS